MSGYSSMAAVREVIESTLRMEERNPADYNLSGIARDAFTYRGAGYGYGAEDEAAWRAAVDRHHRPAARAREAARVHQAAGQLARFDVYPPEQNSRRGHCMICRTFVEPGAGLICLGHDEGGTFAAPLHKRCGALVTAEHERRRVASDAAMSAVAAADAAAR